jgi:hypothetical protein
MIVKPEGFYRVGVQGVITVEVSANAPLQGQIEITGDSDGIQPAIVQNVGTAAQAVSIPFMPVKAGTILITFEARWGFKNLPSPSNVTVNVEEGERRPITDALDEKLKKMFG